MLNPSDKLIVLGMGSQSDKKVYESTKIGGANPVQFLQRAGIKVYHNPATNDPYLVTSIHRTTLASIKYAHMMNEFAVGGHNITGIFLGGLALALPGVAAAEMPLVPAIGVPTDIDALYNTFKIPDGTGEATTGIGGLETAIRQAERILNIPEEPAVHLIFDADYKKKADVETMLNQLHVRYQSHEYKRGEMREKYDGITLLLTTGGGDWVEEMKTRLHIGIACPQDRDARDVDAYAQGNTSMLFVGRPINTAIFAARILAAKNKDIAHELLEYRKIEAAKYPNQVQIVPAHFK